MNGFRSGWCGGMVCAGGLLLGVALILQASDSPADGTEAARTPGAEENVPEAATADAQAASRPAVGSTLPDFHLPSLSGGQTALSDFRDRKLVVVAFLGTECPIGNLYLPDLNALHEARAEQGVQLVGIHSNPQDTPEKIAAHAKEFEIAFPVLVDRDQRVADLFGAERTSEVFVLDARRVIRYRGRIDDRFGYTFKRKDARRADLAEAVRELLAGEPVSVPETEVQGCLISRPQRRAEGEVTYARQVSRIIQEKCRDCHRPDTAAPFALLTYDDAADWSAMIREVVVQRRMPPWHADPRYGHFENEVRLTQEEIDTLVAWIDGGTPLGDESELPPPREYVGGWRIGQPDVVFEMPREFTVPATGTVQYQYFVTKTDFEEDMWIQAAEARPGNLSAVHHIIVFHRDPNSGRTGDVLNGWLVGVAPGTPPTIFPEGFGRKIPAGSELVWQVHYTPTGREETDRSQVGFIFCKEPPKHAVLNRGIANHRFRIPPGDPHHRVESQISVPRDALLLSFLPHMHLRGKDFEYRAVYPDGTAEILLSVPNYDFNWQHAYRLAEPKRVPAGTRLECVAHFDNSPDNPANPDPEATVRWGDQTWEEMMIGYVNFVWAEAD